MSNADQNGEASPLLAVLRARIAREGPIPVDQYMRACLAHPEHGYWRSAQTIGTGGDFITAPEISQVFGELIGLWCAVVWQSMGNPSPLRFVELGPGRGTLMRDALRAARAVPPFLAASTVHLVETSAPLREAQRQTLSSLLTPTSPAPPLPTGERAVRHDLRAPQLHREFRREETARKSFGEQGEGGLVAEGEEGSLTPTLSPRGEGDAALRGAVPIAWHEAVEQVPEGSAIIIANEFLDALPIRQLVFSDSAWCERVVDVCARGALQFAVGPKTPAGAEKLEASPPPGTIVELRAEEDELFARLAGRASPLVALFVDYGPAQPATGDTLQAVRRHAWVDPLSRPGRTDLTAHVQFASLAGKARAAGLVADGPMTQGEFLGRLGVAERAARLMAANPDEAANIEAGVQRLISPTGMGELFKVLAVRSRSLPPTVPFS
jgi:NADH dehydrogenase [ubiquinone] 1 alpha subcomplex assembly factor 7